MLILCPHGSSMYKEITQDKAKTKCHLPPLSVFSSSDLLPCLYIVSVDRRHSCQVAGDDVSSGVGTIVGLCRLTGKSQLLSQKGVTSDYRGGEAPLTPGSHGYVWQSAGERPESLYPASSLSYLQNQQSQWDHFSQSGPGTSSWER